MLHRVFLSVFMVAALLFGCVCPVSAALDELMVGENIFSPNRNSREVEQVNEYVVREGDTLYAIAASCGASPSKIAELNNLADYNRIKVGQVLIISPASTYEYIIEPGDTLSGIAARYAVNMERVSELNNLPDEDMLLVGQRLKIPGGKDPETGAITASPSILSWPVPGWISSPFGLRGDRMHEGIDIAANHGAEISAAEAGRVVYAGERGTYGLTVILDHGGGLSTLYAHASEVLVRSGQWVEKGQVVARVGNTGFSQGPHLHFEVLCNGVPCDPLFCTEPEKL